MLRSLAIAALLATACAKGASGPGSGPDCPKGPLKYGPPAPPIAVTDAHLENGRLMVNGARVFLKTAVHLSNYATTDFSSGSIVDRMRAKGYSNWKMNLYWKDFDDRGDGGLHLDPSLTHLKGALAAARSHGIYVDLSFETYAVGGGGVPDGFFAAHPEAQAVTETGARAVDTEWNPKQRIPSFFNPAYLAASRGFVKNVLSGLSAEDLSGVIYYETTVEPQFAGVDVLDYSSDAHAAFDAWCAVNGPCPAWPPPGPDATWNRFRAQALAAWIDGDAAAIRSVVGAQALIAVDYVETGTQNDAAGKPMWHRNGDSMTFLNALSGASILQVNWHWYPPTHTPFDVGYDNARSLQGAKGWAISEHQTIAGEWFTGQDVPALLDHSLAEGNRFGWEIVDFANSDRYQMPIYHDDWTPKPQVAGFDCAHDEYMGKAYAAQ